MRRRICGVAVALVALLSGWLVQAPVTGATDACFQETGHCIQGRFLAYWQDHGGLAINGFPLSDERQELLEDGHIYTVQYFERVRMEYHPENQPPYDVLLGQFGRRVLRERFRTDDLLYQVTVQPVAPIAGQTYFAATGHNLGGAFLDYWRQNGGLAQFGFPLTEEFDEWNVLPNQNTRVQYFERARLEYHPENQAPYTILLGQFGRDILAQANLLVGDFGYLYITNMDVRGRLGRPVGPIMQAPGAIQAFQQGIMLYQGDQKRIYVFCGDQDHGQIIPSGSYPTEQQTIYFPDTWTEGQDPGGGSAPVAGLYYPGRGFGKVWRENPDSVQRCLGYALMVAETGYTITTQQFERGLLLTDSVGHIYVVSFGFGKCCGLGGSYTRYEAPRR